MSAEREAPGVHEVLIIGAGPSGTLLAAELRRLGVEALLIERRTDSAPGSRAIGVHPPVLAALEPSGATARILEGAARIPRGMARAAGRTIATVRFDRRHPRFPFIAAAPQQVTEAALAAIAPEPLRGMRVIGVHAAGDLMRVRAEDAAGDTTVWAARTVVVAAGARGRQLLSGFLPVRAHAYADRYLMTDLADAPGEPEHTAVITLGASGVAESFPLPNGGRRLVARVTAAGPHEARERRGRLTSAGADIGDAEIGDRTGEVDLAGPLARAAQAADVDRLAAAVLERIGRAELASRVTAATGFGIRRVLLSRMVSGPWAQHGAGSGYVIAIGDAAHEVSPIGGQGMNLGLLDAVTLAPVLARLHAHALVDEPHALAHWERNRLASARTAGRLAGLNTALGRPWPRPVTGTIAAAMRTAMRTPLVRLPERAYAMGFDRDA
ncbi:FAD-dependent oxidoreductase [Leucobacter japonicus]|uniref:FAD-dependent oxidoreductase n=1 Tax=Leucobacter japonicus TaxID=1461259 RepID=UPI0006A761EC|nr:NAD(P)/FAD-dependent oxidoreductase [Leucobacter japonicus]